MTGGALSFSVDGTACDNDPGVGFGGGVFNCGKTGTSFTLTCTSACTPKLAIVELKLYKLATLNLEGSAYLMANS